MTCECIERNYTNHMRLREVLKFRTPKGEMFAGECFVFSRDRPVPHNGRGPECTRGSLSLWPRTWLLWDVGYPPIN